MIDTIVSLLRDRADKTGDKTAYRFVEQAGQLPVEISYQDLEKEAIALAKVLQKKCRPGDRALMLYHSGREFILGFFACIYAGVIAVPAYPPRKNQKMNRLQAIIEDAQASVVLTTQNTANKIQKIYPENTSLDQLIWINTDQVRAQKTEDAFEFPKIKKEDILFLQYTSGSTGNPKGVMVSHENIMANEAIICTAFEHDDSSHYVSWLPYFHDMGLIGAILQALYADIPLTLMSPMYFLQKPVRWLRAISDCKATVSGGPNFAFDLCVDQIKEEDLEGIDLSSWRLAYNGAEPVSAETLERFYQRFKKYGFKKNAFFPCFGLAEATLVVSGHLNEQGPTILQIDSSAFQKGIIETSENPEKAQALVSCGRTWPEHEIKIVDPETLKVCTPDQVGEIWFKGPSVAQGYWNKPEESKETFAAYVPATGEGPFLRTGDLGVYRDSELYIAGRIKDLLVIRGRNYYPQDIEALASHAHEAFVTNSVAAFSVDTEEGEQLVIIQELKRTFVRSMNATELFNAVMTAVAGEFDLKVQDILFLKPGRIRKTSSGKIQRQGNKQAYLNNEFEALAQWRTTKLDDEIAVEKPPSNAVSISENKLQQWIQNKIADKLKFPIHRINVDQNFHSFGLDSLAAIQLSNDIAEYLKIEVPPILIYDYPTIKLLTAHLLGDQKTPDFNVQKDKNIDQDIAIIGIGCKFPGANNIAEFEKVLYNGLNEIKTPGHEINLENDPRNLVYRAGYLEGIDQFDSAFFEIAPKEARAIDPQQRLLLEVAYHTIQEGGYTIEKLKGSDTGVFIGVSNSDYVSLTLHEKQHQNPYFGTGNSHSITANRLSYFYDWKGPSIAVDTACSSSLVAVHQAVRSIRNGECQMALTGGVNLILSDAVNEYLDAGTLLAKDGHCKTFDATADGYVRGEGLGLLLLKSKREAIKDKDPILAVIKGSALVQDGHSNGLLAPNGLAQQEVLKKALQDAQVAPEQVAYVEAHGTGTALGDPIEVSALHQVYGNRKKEVPPLWVGSVKANIGHLESAAGIAGLIKTIILLRKNKIPKQVHFQTHNPNISWEKINVKIPTEIVPLMNEESSVYAGVSSFGFGGMNAHLIVEKAPIYNAKELPKATSNEATALLLISAKSKEALKQQAQNVSDIFEKNPALNVQDLAYSLATHRDHFYYRMAFLHQDVQTTQQALQELLPQKKETTTLKKKAFLFTGGGAQYVGMLDELYDAEPVFQQAIQECVRIVNKYLDKDLLQILQAQEGSAEAELLHRIDYMQPALFAYEYAMCQLWHSWGIEAEVLIGHSLGEIVAACVAGVFSLEDGLKLICSRGQLMQSLPAGGVMISIQADEEAIRKYIGKENTKVSIAVINGSDQTVIAGERVAAEKLKEIFDQKGVKTKTLEVSHASHSVLMDPILEAYGKVVASIKFQEPTKLLISNLKNDLAIDSPDYWISHLRDTVRFNLGLARLEQEDVGAMIEVGPHPVLLGIAGQSLENSEALLLIPSARKNEKDTIKNSLAQLYVQGETIDWGAFYAEKNADRIALSPYPFQREAYWIERKIPTLLNGQSTGHPLLGYELNLAGEKRIFESIWSLDVLTYLQDHQVFGKVLVPGAVYCEAIQAFIQYEKTTTLMLGDIVFEQPMCLTEDTPYRIQLMLQENGDKSFSFEFHAKAITESADQEWQVFAKGNLVASDFNSIKKLENFKAIRRKYKDGDLLDVDEFYRSFSFKKMDYGLSFQTVHEITRQKDAVFGKIILNEKTISETEETYHLHPTLLDGALQLLASLSTTDETAYLPFLIEGYQLSSVAGQEVWVELIQLPNESSESIKVGQLKFWDQDGNLLGGIEKVLVKQVEASQLISSIRKDWLYQLSWQEFQLNKFTYQLAGQIWLLISPDPTAELVLSFAEKLKQKKAKVLLLDDWTKAKKDISTASYILNFWPQRNTNDVALDAQTNILKGLDQLQSLVNKPPLALKGFAWITESATDHPQRTSINPTLGALWGLGRVFLEEYRELAFKLVDIDRFGLEACTAELLMDVVLCAEDENQIAIQNQGLSALRLIQDTSTPTDKKQQPYQLSIPSSGTLDDIACVTVEDKGIQENEVEIKVYHAGLNFRDIFRALDLIATDRGALGGECAGVVTKVGSAVRDFKIGDEVIALAEGSISNRVKTDARLVIHKPKALSFAEGATIPIAFLTAWYSLHYLAKLQRGERILIHSAAGAVGMAATQIAQHLGADSLGTASLPKHDAISGAGISHLFNSRTLDFYDQIKGLDDGKVDVVLNSFIGPFVDKSLELLNVGGRFIEIGKRDIRNEAEVQAIHPEINYGVFDLIQLMKNQPELVAQMFRELMPLFEQQTLKPIRNTIFSIKESVDAFKFMAQAKHIGKVVVAIDENIAEAKDELQITPKSTVLITGGTGGLGLELTDYLIQKYQVQHFVLLSRSEPKEEVAKRIKAFEKAGTIITVRQADVADQNALAEVLNTIPTAYPLLGIIHLAGVLDDGMLADQNPERFKAVMAPKILGAWNLHQLTKEKHLAFFTLFSSAAAVTGSIGQSNYAAANAFMDALAQDRVFKDLPAQSINWGPWATAGLVHNLDQAYQQRIKSQGYDFISIKEGMDLNDFLLKTKQPHPIALPLNLPKMAHHFNNNFEKTPSLYRVLLADQKFKTKDKTGGIIAQLQGIEPAKRSSKLEKILQKEVAQILSVKVIESIHLDRSLQEFGMDSLMAVQLKNKLSTLFGMKLPVTLLFDYPNIQSLAAFLNQEVADLQKTETKERPIAPEEDWKKIVADQLMAQLQDIDTAQHSVKDMIKELENMLAKASNKEVVNVQEDFEQMSLEDLESELENELKDL